MDLNEVSVFIQVVQSGSFTQAARQLQMPNSTVSAKVSSLEKRLGLTLIQRTTRKLHVTPAGEAYFRKCLEGLERIRAAESEVVAAQGEPQGLLRITAPIELGTSVIPLVLSNFVAKYPKVNVEVLLTDRRIDLLADGVDLAIRAGELKDSSLISKKLGSATFSLFASPKYLKGRSIPKQPRDLADHQCLPFTPLGTDAWKLTNGRSTVTAPLRSRVILNDLNLGKNLAVAGNGIALIPTFFCRQELKDGKLVRVLPEWRTGTSPVHFVYPAQRFVTPKLAAFIELATEPIRRVLVDA
ncbi:MAG: LysR family transcriptional regulator [Bdellovibrionota bacterium]